MDEAAELVIAPFRDIVEKGKQAVENAGDNEAMLKAAQSLVREGERALKKIEPLCKKQAEEYRSNFVLALKENENITKYRTELNDLLWEFDEFIEADDFQQDKFAELQALSRKAAPQIYDLLMRMKLEALPREDAPRIMAQLSPPTSPHSSPIIKIPGPPGPLHAAHLNPPSHPPPTAPLPPLPLPAISTAVSRTRSSGGSSRSPQSDSRAPTPGRGSEATTPKRSTAPPLSREPSGHGSIPDTAAEPPPRHPERPPPPPMPMANPWDTKTRPKGDPIQIRERPVMDRRPPVLAAAAPIELGATVPASISTMQAHAIMQSNSTASDDNRLRRGNTPPNMYTIFPTPAGNRSRAGTLTNSSIPEHNVADMVLQGHTSEVSAPYSPASYPIQPRHLSLVPSIDSDYSLSHLSHSPRSSGGPVSDSVAQRGSSTSMGTMQAQAGLEVAGIVPSRNADHGLIPVTSDSPASPIETSNSTSRDCSIRPDSSFYLARGFCAGALEVTRGGIGVKKTGLASSSTIARCSSCMYELDFAEIEEDVNRQDSGTRSLNGVNYRLRFLQKSHLSAKRSDDVPYACVFCIHLGKTIDESDATVFFTPRQLLEHLSRHPRPLPDVPGITAIDTPELPSHLRNDFDVHFPKPTQKHPAKEKAVENAHLPVGIARESVRRVYGQRLLPDRTRAHEVAIGGKVTALTWPEKYAGEWCLGWHDSVYASIPTNCLRLETPPQQELRTGGVSSIRARTRWRFKPNDKDPGDWLRFDKNEVITNINWAYIDHWCWSGINAKGKWGIFPQAFIDTNTIQELGTGSNDRAVSLSNEKAKSTGMLSKFTLRRNASHRPPSIAGSSSSHETATPGFGNAQTPPRSGRDFLISGGDS
ncbi:hypothetical protein S40288_07786 [Stachybotrys chartarum IBT 40288]|nr:hypothetical protein S40288_07786 [Stachybotrys chartarum IBT 40288]